MMKVYYKTILREDNEKFPMQFKLISVEFCCDRMKENYEDGWIHFGEGEVINHSNQLHLNRFHKKWESKPIHFCPYCGASIEPIEGKRVRGIYRIIPTIVNRSKYEEVDE